MQGFFTQNTPSVEPRLAQLEGRVQGLEHAHEKMWKWFVNSWRQTCILSVKDRLAAQGRTPRLPVEFKSQIGEDLFLWNLFEGKLDGFYIEVGGFDGYNLSVSYAFDAAGWDGVLVEPVPPNYEKCKARRPYANVVNAALSRPGAAPTATFCHVLDDYGGALSYLPDSGGNAPVVKPGAFSEVKYQVPVRTMDSVLEGLGDRLQGRRIDFASIDVEGHEPELLAGFSLERWKPRVVLMEDNSKGNDLSMQQEMERRGYRPVFVLAFDVFYIHEGETELLKRAREVF